MHVVIVTDEMLNVENEYFWKVRAPEYGDTTLMFPLPIEFAPT